MIKLLIALVLLTPVAFASPLPSDIFQYTDKKKAYNELLILANNGDPIAKYYLGLLYAFGNGVDKNTEKAEQLLADASKQGVIKATTMLASFYFTGNLNEINYTKSYLLWRKSALVGNHESQLILGNFLTSQDNYLPGKELEGIAWLHIANSNKALTGEHLETYNNLVSALKPNELDQINIFVSKLKNIPND